MPDTGVVDYIVAFLLNTLFPKIPTTPVIMANTKHRLNPITFSMYDPMVRTPKQVNAK